MSGVKVLKKVECSKRLMGSPEEHKFAVNSTVWASWVRYGNRRNLFKILSEKKSIFPYCWKDREKCGCDNLYPTLARESALSFPSMLRW